MVEKYIIKSNYLFILLFTNIFFSCNNINEFEYNQTIENKECYLDLLNEIQDSENIKFLKQSRSSKIKHGPITTPKDYRQIDLNKLFSKISLAWKTNCFHVDSKTIDFEGLRISDDDTIIIEVSMVKKNSLKEHLTRDETREYHRIIKGDLSRDLLKNFTFNEEKIVKKELIGKNTYYLITQISV